jgi:DNA polymerase-1
MIRFEVSGPVGWRRHHLKAFVKAFEQIEGPEAQPSLLFADNLNLDDAEDRRQFARETVRFSHNGATPDTVERTLLALYAEWETQCPRPVDDSPDAEQRDSQKAEKRPNQATQLVQLVAGPGIELFHNPDGDAYATLDLGTHQQTWPLRSVAFRDFLARRYYTEIGHVPNSQALTDATGVLSGRALYEGPTLPVAVRLGAHEDRIYLDLGNEQWQAVEIMATGWRVVANPPVRFRRPRGMLPLPPPIAGGSIDELRPFVNVGTGPEGDQQFRLLLAFLMDVLRPTGPHQVLAVHGQQGATKSTLTRIIRALLDPNTTPTRKTPRDDADLAIAANNALLVAYDNLSTLPDWLSDAISRLATGAGLAKRALYTDGDEALFQATRPVVFNGIEELARRSDLLDRCLLLYLPKLPRGQRQKEKLFWLRFEAARPRILGCLLDGVVAALRAGDSLDLGPLPRMADCAYWAACAMPAFGCRPRAFLAEYVAHTESHHQLVVEASPLASAVLEYSKTLPDGTWEGHGAELLTELDGLRGDKKPPKGWPTTAAHLVNAIHRLVPDLLLAGLAVEDLPRTGQNGRRLRLTVLPPDHSPEPPPPEDSGLPAEESPKWASPASPASRSAPVQGCTGDAGSDAPGDAPTNGDVDDAQPNVGDAVGVAPDASSVTAESGASTGDMAVGDAGDARLRVCSVSELVRSDADYTVLTTVSAVNAALPLMLAAPVLGLDTETTGLDPREHRVRLIQLATPDHVYLLDAFQVDARALAPVLTDGPRLVLHHAKFDLHMLAAAGLPLPAGTRLFDTQLAAQLLGAGSSDGMLNHCSLAAVVARLLGETVDKQEQRSDWAGPLSDAQLRYAARDAAILLPLMKRLEAELAIADLRRVAALEMRAVPAVVWLEQTGAPFDADAWAALSDGAMAEQFRLEQELTALTGSSDLFGSSTINWASPSQVLRVLRARGHEIAHTDEDALAGLADREPLARLLLAHREASRRASVYGIEFLQHVAPTTGRIHAEYLQLGSRAGRMSCQRPNLQQVPREPAYRACFRPAAGRVLVKADYSQIELRIAAELTGDARMLVAYETGEDLHRVTAAAVMQRAGASVRPEDRQAAKALNFGLLYGMGAERLREYAASNYGVSLTAAEAERFRARFFDTYPGLRAWHRRQPSSTVDTRTLAGRRRLDVAKFTEKLNTPVQGTGADGLKAALALLWETRDRCPSGAPVLCVHDEIVIECDVADAEIAQAWLVDAMRRGMGSFLRRVPVEIEAKRGGDWSMTP